MCIRPSLARRWKGRKANIGKGSHRPAVPGIRGAVELGKGAAALRFWQRHHRRQYREPPSAGAAFPLPKGWSRAAAPTDAYCSRSSSCALTDQGMSSQSSTRPIGLKFGPKTGGCERPADAVQGNRPPESDLQRTFVPSSCSRRRYLPRKCRNRRPIAAASWPTTTIAREPMCFFFADNAGYTIVAVVGEHLCRMFKHTGERGGVTRGYCGGGGTPTSVGPGQIDSSPPGLLPRCPPEP